MDEATQIKTTVVIPVYNTEDYLPACLDSVLAQTQREIEVILVDDGSTDGSLDIERAYAARDPRVRIIQQPNLRQGTARNRGLAEARGEYIYFMDSDDLIVPEHFETCYAICERDNLDFVTFDTVGFVDDPDVGCPDHFEEVRDRSQTVNTDITDGVSFWMEYQHSGNLPWICWLEYFRHDFLIDNNLQFVEGIYFEDNDWAVRVYLAAKRLRYLPLKLHRYRERPGSNVHSGFNSVLAESSFKVFDLLLDIRMQQSTPDRIRMVEDAINGVALLRFRQIKWLRNPGDLREKARDFSLTLRSRCTDPAVPPELKRLNLRALFNLEAGMSRWQGYSSPIPQSLAESILLPDILIDSDNRRIGLYGTGIACALLMSLWDPGDRKVFFFETDPSPDKMFEGKPVHGASAIESLQLDAILITSEKYADSMRAAIEAHSDGSIPIDVLTRYILALDALDKGARLENR